MKGFPFWLLLPLLASGCFVTRATRNEPLSQAAIEGLRPGMSAREVVERLGAPTEVVQLGLRSAYRYDFTQQKRAGLTLILVTFLNDDERQDRVWLFFDEEGALTHVGATLQAAGSQYAMPWSDLEPTR